MYLPPLPKSARTVLPYAVIALLAVLLYANTFSHGFVFDDQAVLKGNTFIQKGLDGLSDIFTKGSWDGYDASVDMHIYRPLQLAFLALQYEFFGLEPMGYHVVHVLTYALTCCLIFGLLRRLFREIEFGEALALLTTLIYAVHPVHTEVVANIKGNGDLIAMLLGIASLTCLWQHAQKRSWWQLAAASGLFLLALLTKETIVCLVGVAALMLYFFSKSTVKQIVVAVVPLLVMVGVYLALRSLVFGDDAQKLTQTTKFDNYVYMAEGLSQELGLRLYALGKNLQLSLAPYPLQFMYVYDSVPMVEVWDIRALFSLAAYLLLGLAFLLNLKKNNVWGFAIGYFLVTLALFTNTVFSIPNIVSERWLLMPSLGAAMAMAYALLLLSQHSRKTAAGLTLLLMVGYSGYTIERNNAWESNLTLMETDVRTAPRNSMALRFLATLYVNKAETEANREENLREAAYYQERFLELAPNDAAQHHKLGVIYEKLGEHRKAAEVFKKVAGFVSPLQEEAELLYAKNANAGGLYRDALPVWAALRKREPESVEIAAGHTVALMKAGDEENAEASFSRLLDLANTSQNGETPHTSLNNLGIQLEKMGAHEKAAHAFGLAASDESPIQGKAAFSRAKNLNLAKLFGEAVPFWLELDRKYPGVIDVKLGLTTALIGAGRKDEALRAARALHTLLARETSEALSAKQAIAVNSIAVSLEIWGAHDLAALLFQKAASVESTIRGRAHFSQAKNLNLAQSYEKARAVWLALQKAHPSVPEVYLGKAEALAGVNETEEAIRAYEKAISLIETTGIRNKHGALREKALERIAELKAAQGNGPRSR